MSKVKQERMFNVEDWRHFMFAAVLVGGLLLAMLVLDHFADCDDRQGHRDDTTWAVR